MILSANVKTRLKTTSYYPLSHQSHDTISGKCIVADEEIFLEKERMKAIIYHQVQS